MILFSRDSSDEEYVSKKKRATRDYGYHSDDEQDYLLGGEYDEERNIGDEDGWEDEFEYAENYGVDEEYEDMNGVFYYSEDNDHGWKKRMCENWMVSKIADHDYLLNGCLYKIEVVLALYCVQSVLVLYKLVVYGFLDDDMSYAHNV